MNRMTVEDGYNDDYPFLDFMLSDDYGESGIYAEDQVVIGPDGPELAPLELPWDNDDDDDDYYDDPVSQSRDEEEEFYVLSERELSSCYEEWEDYC